MMCTHLFLSQITLHQGRRDTILGIKASCLLFLSASQLLSLMSALDFQHRDLAWVTRDPFKGFLDDSEESGTVITTHSSSTFPHSNVSEFAMATRQKDEVLQQIRTFLRTFTVSQLHGLIAIHALIAYVRHQVPVAVGIVTDEEITREAATYIQQQQQQNQNQIQQLPQDQPPHQDPPTPRNPPVEDVAVVSGDESGSRSSLENSGTHRLPPASANNPTSGGSLTPADIGVMAGTYGNGNDDSVCNMEPNPVNRTTTAAETVEDNATEDTEGDDDRKPAAQERKEED